MSDCMNEYKNKSLSWPLAVSTDRKYDMKKRQLPNGWKAGLPQPQEVVLLIINNFRYVALT